MNSIRNFFVALESGFRAGLKQYRKRRTELARGPIVKSPAGPQEMAQ